MKILPVPLIRDADAFTIAHEPIAAIDLMERAASCCLGWLGEHIPKDRTLKVFCGSGNNGGDGFAVARLLFLQGYTVETYLVSPVDRMSDDCLINFQRLGPCKDAGMPACVVLHDSNSLPVVNQDDIVIDAIFGNGLTRPPAGREAAVIRHINESGALVISIDIPSGLFCDASVKNFPGEGIISADYTLTFSPPKLALFFPENDDYLGNWQLIDIGLSPAFIEAAQTRNFMLGEQDVAMVLKPRKKFSHKGTYGHALLIAGSAGKTGAAVLSALSCARSGCGLVTVRVPQTCTNILQTTVPEAMVSIDPGTDYFSVVPTLDPYTAVGIGPGIGTTQPTATALKLLIQQVSAPMVLDADALNILAENKTWLGFLPKGSVLTPHPKEFERLAGKTSDHFERNLVQREFSYKYQCYVVLKGANTAITTPDGRCYFNTTGNPGMATGGSGDVLTGLITGLLAQGYSPFESCALGVYLHGRAGDLALKEHGYEALIAQDIIHNLGKSFQSLYGKF